MFNTRIRIILFCLKFHWFRRLILALGMYIPYTNITRTFDPFSVTAVRVQCHANHERIRGFFYYYYYCSFVPHTTRLPGPSDRRNRARGASWPDSSLPSRRFFLLFFGHCERSRLPPHCRGAHGREKLLIPALRHPPDPEGSSGITRVQRV